VIQDKSYVESDLHLSVLNYLALLFTEEVKFKVKLQGHRDLDFPFISDCLDNTGTSSVALLSLSHMAICSRIYSVDGLSKVPMCLTDFLFFMGMIFL